VGISKALGKFEKNADFYENDRTMKPPIPQNEAERLAALRRYAILDTAPERAYDDIVKVAAYVCGTPTAIISLVDADRQWFKAKVGAVASETPREQSFCAHAIVTNQTLVVEDAAADRRFADNPLVTAENGIRFYAGAPLVTTDGQGLGSLCVIDSEVRKIDDKQREALEALARMVVSNMELRRVSAELSKQLANVKILGGLLPICGHCKNIRNDRGYWEKIEFFVKNNSEATFTHGICPECAKIYFPDVLRD
jgi:GAF domain-containing protein